MPKTVNPSYMTLSALYRRQNPYQTRGNALMERANMQNSGFAAPGLAFVAGRQMAQAGEFDQRQQDLLEQQGAQKEDKQDVEGKIKGYQLVMNLLDKGMPDVAIDFINKSPEIFGLSSNMKIDALQNNPHNKAFKDFRIIDKKTGDVKMGGIDTRTGKFYVGAPNAEGKMEYKPAPPDAFKISPQEEKDTRTTTAKDFERAQTDPAFKQHLIDTGKMIDPEGAEPNQGVFYRIGEDGVAQPMKDDKGNLLYTGDKNNKIFQPRAGKGGKDVITKPDGSTVDLGAVFSSDTKTPPKAPAPTVAPNVQSGAQAELARRRKLKAQQPITPEEEE